MKPPPLLLLSCATSDNAPLPPPLNIWHNTWGSRSLQPLGGTSRPSVCRREDQGQERHCGQRDPEGPVSLLPRQTDAPTRIGKATLEGLWVLATAVLTGSEGWASEVLSGWG